MEIWKKRVFLVGYPGSGKGTLIKGAKQDLEIDAIIMGEMLRKCPETRNGELVKDISFVVSCLKREIAKGRRNLTFIDGFPRNAEQADHLKCIPGKHLVVYLKVSEESALKRMLERQVCPDCYTPFGSEDVICSECGSKLKKRPDDTPELASKRVKEQKIAIERILEHRLVRRNLVVVNANVHKSLVYGAVHEKLVERDFLNLE